METPARSSHAPISECEDVLRLLDDESLDFDSSSSEDSICDLTLKMAWIQVLLAINGE